MQRYAVQVAGFMPCPRPDLPGREVTIRTLTAWMQMAAYMDKTCCTVPVFCEQTEAV